ncbi:MAG: class I SAM-dependent methyltransferase [Oscillospiraceae bacterium]|nr:class I SAM-dependent methyltransferase [Oscillospiraceae bacterium]
MKVQTQRETTEILEGLTSYWSDRSHSYCAQNIQEMNNWKRDAWRNLILSHAPAGERLRVLDVGTGPGFFAMNLALAGHEVTAIDVTEHMLYHARENAEAYGAEVTFIHQRGEFLPFEDESFDLIVSRNVTWNLEYPELALRQWERVLAPGGRMVYFDANWYLYLFDDELRSRITRHKAAFAAAHPEHRSTGDLDPDRVRDLEEIAYSLPLSRQKRPEWDRRVLSSIGMKLVRVIDNVGPFVQDETERLRDSVTPVFMVCAEKEVV